MGTSSIRIEGDVAATLTSLLATGSAAHPFVSHLAAPRAPMADLADAVHALCLLHGRHPGVIDLAIERAAGPARTWLEQAANAFAQERAVLARLAAAVGPLPSGRKYRATTASITPPKRSHSTSSTNNSPHSRPLNTTNRYSRTAKSPPWSPRTATPTPSCRPGPGPARHDPTHPGPPTAATPGCRPANWS